MTDKVVKLRLVEVGDDFHVHPDDLLEDAKGQGFTTLLIAGERADGTIWLSSSDSLGAALILLEMAKHKLIFGE